MSLAFHNAPSLRTIDEYFELRWYLRITEKGVEFKGGSLHDGFGGFDGFGSSGEHLALLVFVLQNTAQSGNRGGFDGFGGFGGHGGLSHDGYPP